MTIPNVYLSWAKGLGMDGTSLGAYNSLCAHSHSVLVCSLNQAGMKQVINE